MHPGPLQLNVGEEVLGGMLDEELVLGEELLLEELVLDEEPELEELVLDEELLPLSRSSDRAKNANGNSAFGLIRLGCCIEDIILNRLGG